MATTLHEHLKESTRRLHEGAEANHFQGALAQGKLSLASYKSYLQQLTYFHERFERMLKEAAKKDKLVSSVVEDDYFQLPYLQADLKALNISAQEPAVAAIDECLSSQQLAQSPVGLIGLLYVLLGSKHGAKFIAHNVKQAYSLSNGGYTYFDPYGERFRTVWTGFTGKLNALPDEAQIKDAALYGARAGFELFVSIGDELLKRQKDGARA
jgi:heme oxygenase